MSLQSDIARAYQDRRTQITHTATARALRIWKRGNVADLDGSWDSIAPQLVLQVTAAQVAAAREATPYLRKSAATVGGSPEKASLIPEAFGGVTLDGREIGPAMFGAVTNTKTAIGAGIDAGRAFEIGASFLATIVGAAVQDMGRQADATIATGHGFSHYIRVLSPGACSRCAVLAGKGDYSRPFKRHPRCKCTSFLIADDDESAVPAGFTTSPGAYFESLSKAERERVFTKAGAAAIDNGADISSVVNARRGAYGINYSARYSAPKGAARRLKRVQIGVKADGSPLLVYATNDATTVRGGFGRAEVARAGESIKTGRYRRTINTRLMPEQIAVMAGHDPARWRELLMKYGYLTP
jgi:hypothetical protein